MTARRGGAIVCTALIVIAGSLPAAAYPRPGRTERVSVSSDGAQQNGQSPPIALRLPPSVSADGRYVSFASTADNLIPGITNGVRDIFVRDQENGATERVSVDSDGIEANGDSFFMSISADGRYVAFDSFASNLVPGDTNGFFDVFLHDRETGTTERVSVASDGTEGNERSLFPSITADGRYVAFFSFASDLVPGDSNGAPDAFIHDRETGTTERVSVANDGTEGNADSFSRGISADGRYVAFQSDASNLVPGDTNGRSDMFVHDRETGETERVSVASDGTQGDNDSMAGTPFSISADGRYVAFFSFASTLVPGDTNGVQDIFVHDRETGTTERVSVASSGAEGNDVFGPFPDSSISADGRFVAFDSFASDLAEGDANGTRDVFVHDREAGTTQRVSVGTDGAEGNGASLAPAISADGRYVAFDSAASNVVPGDTNARTDMFVHDRGPATGIGGVAVQDGTNAVAVSGWATFSGTIVASAMDPGDDGEVGARELGAEMTGALVTYRPEQEDLLMHMDLASLPPGLGRRVCLGVCVDTPGEVRGVPGVLYAWAFTVGGAAYEVRALRAAPAADPPTADPYFALYRCAPDCTEQALLSGGIGTTGVEFRVALPLEELGAGPGSALTLLRAFTALGEATTGEVVTLDELALPDATLPAPMVTLGIAPTGTPEDDVVFDNEAALSDGDFSGSLDISSLSPGEYDVWARACLGDICGSASAPVTLGAVVEKIATDLELTVTGRGNNRTLDARLADEDLPAHGIADRAIDFYADGELIGSVITDADGVATLKAPPRYRGGKHDFEARFEGDDQYLASSDRWQT